MENLLENLRQYITPTLVFPIVTVICLILFFCYYRKAALPREGTLEWISMYEKPPLRFDKRFPMGKKDIIPMLLITLIYAFVAFWGLGDNEAPQSFHLFEKGNKSAVIELAEETEVGSIMYYTGLWTGSYSLEFSADGKNWVEQIEHISDDEPYAMNQPHSKLFYWRYAVLNKDNGPVKFIRITSGRTPMELGELALCDLDGRLISTDQIVLNPSSAALFPSALFDEQDIIPDYPTYMNSAYFDEIYHARTAYENVTNVYPYEISHPPLGKLIISIGIQVFGMTPFGWRFMGTLFGVIMLLFFYVFIKNMFGKTLIAACGTILFAFDFMHYVQTRIATIDTYGVFFVILMYFFMYRYMTTDYEKPFRKTALPLALCGISFGLGAASKWTAIYAGAGLLVLYVIHLIMRGRYYASQNRGDEFVGYLIKTLLFSVLFFIVVPAAIYYLSYIPYGLAKDMTIKDGMLWNREYFDIVWENQKFMFNYHSNVTAEHSYQSRWYQWIINARPILYYRETFANGTKSAFAAFGNPIVWWGGLFAIFAMFARVKGRRDGRALFIIIGYLSQLVPWFFISRTVFVYHYFPSVIFLVLALCHVLNTIWERQFGRYKQAVLGFTGAAVLLFIAFYPVLSGAAVPTWYTTNFLRWIPSAWPF